MTIKRNRTDKDIYAEIEHFIAEFQKIPGALDTFQYGACAWFAQILLMRFPYPALVMYDTITNHFGVKYGSRVYDITGRVEDKYNWQLFDHIIDVDSKWASRIISNCLLYEEYDDEETDD